METTVLQNKISRLLSTSYTDGGTRDALVALDDRISDNTASIRRSLRANTEAEVIKANGEALKKFAPLVTQIQASGDTIADLNHKFTLMQQLVNTCKNETRHVVSEGSELMAQQENISKKRDLLRRYTDAFVLTEKEMDVLKGNDEVPFATFKEVFVKAQKIHKDSEILLANDDTRAGQITMFKANQALENANNTLIRDTETSLINYAQLGETDNFKQDPQLRERLSLLNPVNRAKTLGQFTETRRRQLLKSFTSALTENSHKNGTKALDFYAYDCQRYIGDILAWVYSCVVLETENTSILIGRNDLELVDNCTQSLCSPLRLRVERAVASQTRGPQIFKIAGLVEFYKSMLSKHLPNSQLVETLTQLTAFCNTHFTKTCESRVRNVSVSLPTSLSSDLQPPEFLTQTLVDLKEILEANQQYSLDEHVVRKHIDNSLDPYMEFCRRVALDGADFDAEIFLLNCLDQIIVTLKLYSASEYKVESFQSSVDEIEQVLTDRLFHKFVRQVGLGEDLEPAHLSEISFQLDDFLPSALTDLHSMLFRISSPTIVENIARNSTKKFVEEFSKLEGKVKDKYKVESEYRQFFPRTTEDVELLLGLRS
ncbi:Conserved oligomeric Golgi complex subunit 6 [Yarrowia sp. B02]|nr:Conserved oligomeric Golgi complex subunit 6 [Yarrowia sp. B02]